MPDAESVPLSGERITYVPKHGARKRTLRNLRAAEKQAIAIYVEEGHWAAVARSAVELVALETEMRALEEQ